MLTLYFQNGNVLIHRVEDWIILRKKYRIVGEIIGNSTHIPSLPVRIFPEEALLLMTRAIIEIREIINFAVFNERKNFETELLDHQIVDYKKTRKIQLESVLDSIVEQRRKHNDVRSKEEILADEINKTPPITKNNMIWPIFSIDTIEKQNTRHISLFTIQCCTTLLKFRTYENLYNKGYYITGGAKFGGHFLAYSGDPLCFHAIFIVKCVENDQNISTTEIIAFGRLGTSVKKRAVLASVVNEEIGFLTINWIDA